MRGVRQEANPTALDVFSADEVGFVYLASNLFEVGTGPRKLQNSCRAMTSGPEVVLCTADRGASCFVERRFEAGNPYRVPRNIHDHLTPLDAREVWGCSLYILTGFL